ncbi:hypothetical protein ACFWQ6_00925 [Streptomyces coelicoflavus]|uniref:hypothetical protein n=1 Tax=Streptomyces coelicoflavus TaxID=285562 RepID=UPI003668EA92
MAEVKAEIIVVDCPDHNWFDRRVLGWAWWWHAYLPSGSSSGFARTPQKATAKAEAAARRLAGRAAAASLRYKYEVPDAEA